MQNGQSSLVVPVGSAYVDSTNTRIFWKVAVGETVVYMLKSCNFHDRNTVTAEKDGSHALFSEIGGTIRYTVTGRW